MLPGAGQTAVSKMLESDTVSDLAPTAYKKETIPVFGEPWEILNYLEHRKPAS